MKKRFTILAAAFALLAFLAIPMGMRGQTASFGPDNFSGQGTSGTGSAISATVDGVTFACDKGFGTTQIRCYSGSTITISSSNTITAISFTFSGSYTGGLQTSYTDLSTNSWTQTLASQARIMACSVSYTDGGTPTPTTYTVTYNCNGGTSGCPENVTGIEAGTQIQLAAAPTKTDCTFDGWNDGSTTYQAGANYTVSGNVTMTAQWTEIVSGDEQWILTNLADLTEDDVFVIVGNGYAMTNNNGTSSAPAPVAVTISDNEITSTVSSTIKWTVSGDATNGYTFYPNGSTTTWLYCNTTASSSSNNNMRVGTGGRHIFELNSNNFLVTKDSYTARYLSIYFNNEEAQDWRGYINTNLSPEMSFYKKVTGGVIPPSITAANVDIAYNATSGSIAYTINNGVTGGTMSVATESDWLTLGQGTTSPISFTCTANEGAAERTATVTLTYTYNRATATANVTVTQAGNPNTINYISDITAAGSYTVQGTIVAISNRGFVLGDGTGYVYYYYGSGFEYDSYDIGDIVKLSGSVVVYGGVYEFDNTTTPEYVDESNYVEENPTYLTGEDMDARVISSEAQLSSYVQYGGTLSISGSGSNIHYNIINIDGAQTAKGSISYPLNVDEITALDGKPVIVTGYYVGASSNQYYNTMIGRIEENTEPAILLDTYEIEMAVEGGEGNINATYLNFGDYSFEPYINFYAENGITYATYDWITAEIDANHNVHYVVAANQGEARTAYFRVEYSNYEEPDGKRNDPIVAIDASSDLVTVTQAAYVAPTYAELPFEYNDGLDGIEETDGLYQDGIGSDYNTNNTKLRFDNTGDWLLLQFNERPGTLTFDIKGNTFSGGTFKVQTSEDGETYTDLATYTELGATQSEEFSNLGENVRYIKWIYTEKVSGNVGLGNIVLNAYTEPESSITLDNYNIEVPAEGGEGSVNVTYQNFSGSYCDVYFYAADGVTNATYDWITAELDSDYNVHYVVQANTGEARIAYFKVGDGYESDDDLKSRDGVLVPPAMDVYSDLVTVTQAAYVAPFEPATYTLVTSLDQIESGKTYIIVGSKEVEGETQYYAMGEQKTNNRGGVAISVNGTTVMVETAEVHEFIVTDTLLVDWLKDGGTLNADPMYSIYDTKEHGFLYAASSSSNQLKTETDLDNNGLWTINYGEGDGQFSIVAQGSNTRNVMQFNYNGGNTLFSCYASASQLPVYLYVKEEATTTVTQTITLAQGINWVSFYVETDMDALKEALVEALPGANSITIKSQKNGQTAYNGSRWRGALSTLDLALMYQITVPEGCEFTLEAAPLDPAQHPITIKNGPNWIGFPFNEAMTPTEAFAGLPPVSGDVLKSKTQQTNYSTRWRGALSSLVPGQGYIYNSAETGDKTFVYPTNTNKSVLKIVK